jgi:hypothetical protein
MTNLSQVGHVGEEWGSSTMINFATSLSANVTSANAGALIGNRMFFSNDYMVSKSCATMSGVLKGLY